MSPKAARATWEVLGAGICGSCNRRRALVVQRSEPTEFVDFHLSSILCAPCIRTASRVLERHEARRPSPKATAPERRRAALQRAALRNARRLRDAALAKRRGTR
jgi:hypothetical protein